MSADEDRAEPDRLEGAPHPRETRALFGHEAAEADLLAASRAGRLPHAVLLTGPQGIGKATLGWALARHLLAGSPDTARLGAADPADPVFRQTAALAHPGLVLVRRPWDEKTGRLRAEITVDTVRALRRFFELSSAHGGARVALVDAADDMNTAAANALLKLLEEPPAGGAFILVSHRPARLLPTIRSRCRVLRLAPLGPAPLAAALRAAGAPDPADPAALAELAGGSVGAAFRLLAEGGLETYAAILALLDVAMDRQKLLRLADSGGAAEAGAILDLAALCVARIARAGAGAPLHPVSEREARLFAAFGSRPDQARIWAGALARMTERADHARAVHLDPAQVILDTFLQIEAAAGKAALAA